MTLVEQIEIETRRMTVTSGTAGWEIREEDGRGQVQTACYTDWHRVERALQLFSRRGPESSAKSPEHRPDTRA